MNCIEAPHMTFDVRNYENEVMMMVEVGNVMSALVRNGYQTLFRYEDCGIYVLEYLPSSYSLGDNRFMVVTPEEQEEVYWNREHADDGVDLIPVDEVPDLPVTPPDAGIDDPVWPPVVSK